MPLKTFDAGKRNICGTDVIQTAIWTKDLPQLPSKDIELGNPLLSGFGDGDGTRMYRSIEICPDDVQSGKATEGCDACCETGLPVCPIGYSHVVIFYDATTGAVVPAPTNFTPETGTGGGGGTPVPNPLDVQGVGGNPVVVSGTVALAPQPITTTNPEQIFNTRILRQADGATWDIASVGFVTSLAVLAESVTTNVNGVVLLPTIQGVQYSTNSDYGRLQGHIVTNAATITYVERV